MKFMKAMAIIALAVAVCIPAYAETQTVKVSGELDAYWIYRGEFDLSEGNEASVVPANVAVPSSTPTARATGMGSDADDYFMSVAEIEVAADLTDNVSVVVRLFNQRDWNANAFTAPADASAVRGAANTENEFDVGVDLAYVQMKEIFYAPLTLTLGRQDIWLGRGFVIGLNYQDPQNSIQANEFTAVTSFDAARATLDFDPWTIDVIGIYVDENDLNPEDDRAVYLANVNYQFAEYNAEAEVYYIYDHDRGTLGSNVTTEVAQRTSTIGGRGSFDPIENVTFGGEIAWQFGDYQSALSARSQDIDAFAAQVFGEYRWNEYEWKPMIGIEYTHFSGDENSNQNSGDYEAWNGLFRGQTIGDIRDYQEVFYGTAQTGDDPAGTNQNSFAVYADITPMEDLKLDGQFYWFWTDEDVMVNGSGLDDKIGHELDLHVTYDYTEDVAFGLGLGWFWAGDYFSGPGETGGTTDFNETAKQVVSSVKVAF